MKKVLVINTPAKDKTINRDMAGGLGFSGGAGVVLPPLDLLILVRSLKDKGYKVDFVDGVAEKKDEQAYYQNLINKGKYCTVLGNLSLPTIDDDCQFYASLVKNNSKVEFILKTGINYPRILTRALRQSQAKQIIYCECDLNIDEYLFGNQRAGSIFWKNNKISFGVLPKVLDNLDLLPIPDRGASEWKEYKYSLLPGICTTMQTSRGCPYPCGYYCPYPLVQGTRWRSMSASRIVAEIMEIKKIGINKILFRDATFTLSMPRIKLMCDLLIEKQININWWCETRINVLTIDLIEIMKKAGCKGINVGVETLNEDLIESEGKPGVSLADVIKIRKAAKKIGLKLHFLMIVGLPNESKKSLYGTLKYLLELKPESLGITSITPYPGTKMFDEAKKNNMISNFDWNRFNGSNSNMRTKYLSEGEIELARKMIMAGVYFNSFNGIIKTLGIITVKMAFKIWSFRS